MIVVGGGTCQSASSTRPVLRGANDHFPSTSPILVVVRTYSLDTVRRMADFIQNLDPKSLVTIGAVRLFFRCSIDVIMTRTTQGIAFVVSPFTAPTYNFPLYLFGVYAQESTDATQSLKLVCNVLLNTVSLH